MLTYCDNATETPNLSHNYAFTWDKNVIPLDQDYHYPCQTGMRIENQTATKEEAAEHAVVRCGSDGLLRYPSPWPQCSSTVQCGAPPAATVNGTRVWRAGGEGNEEYAAVVRYECATGQQFDTTGDGAGDSLWLDITCQWRKEWWPWQQLPPCVITHCTENFIIPDHTELEAETISHADLVAVESSGEPASLHPDYMGTYQKLLGQTVNGRPVWKHKVNTAYLYMSDWGDWHLGGDHTKTGPGGHECKFYQTEKDGSVIQQTGWKYLRGNTYTTDSLTTVTGEFMPGTGHIFSQA